MSAPMVRALLGIGCAVLAAGSLAQTPPPPADPACPAATELRPSDLYGLWRLLLWPECGSASTPSSITPLSCRASFSRWTSMS